MFHHDTDGTSTASSFFFPALVRIQVPYMGTMCCILQRYALTLKILPIILKSLSGTIKVADKPFKLFKIFYHLKSILLRN
jgi:hypothetical protein